jgi:hypothetical protein
MLALLVLGLVTAGAPSAPEPSAAPSLRKPALSLRAPLLSLRAAQSPLFAPLANTEQQHFVPRFGLPEGPSLLPTGGVAPTVPAGSPQGSWLVGSFDGVGGLYRVSPLVLKYQVRRMRPIPGSNVYLEAGVQGDHQWNRDDASKNSSSDGAYVGVGLHF